MGIRAYVLARKGVLVSNPDVKNMTDVQWMFEYHALKAKEEMVFKASFTALRKTMVSTLGLNLLRPVDENGFPKPYDKLTEEEENMFLPLVAWCGRPDVLKGVADQVQIEMGLDKVTNPDSEYEAMVAAIDAADGDMEPILGVDTSLAGAKDPKIVSQGKLFVQQIVDVEGDV